MQENVPPHGRVGGGDAGEVTEAAGRELDHLRLGDLFEIGGGADDIVGDEVRHVARDGKDEVVMGGRHDLHIRTQRLPEGLHLRHMIRIGARRRREDAPAIAEELGEAGIGTGMFGPCDRMGGHETDARRQMRRHSRDDRALHRAHIGDNAAGLEMGTDDFGNGSIGADRHTENAKIGVSPGGGEVCLGPVGEAEFHDARAHLFR